MHKIFEKRKFWDFCHFRCQFETSSIRTLQLSLHEDYWTTNFFLVDLLKNSNPRSLSKLKQKLHENVKNREFFVILGFSFQKTAFISSKTTTGQSILALLNLFSIQIHDIYREIDKNCIKTLKTTSFLESSIGHSGVN